MFDTKEIYLYVSRNGAISVPISAEQMDKITDEKSKSLVEHYEAQIKNVMIELSQ